MGAIEEDDDKGKDSGNESIDTDSDAEDKTQSIKAIQNAMVGMNVSRKFSRIFQAFHGHRRGWIMFRSLSSATDLSLIEGELDLVSTTN
jgi:hypothetical protein